MTLAVLLTAWVTGAVVFPLTFALAAETSVEEGEEGDAWVSGVLLGAVWPLSLAFLFLARRKIRSL